nr:unnamed protein product [Digitaria exilis]
MPGKIDVVHSGVDSDDPAERGHGVQECSIDEDGAATVGEISGGSSYASASAAATLAWTMEARRCLGTT